MKARKIPTENTSILHKGKNKQKLQIIEVLYIKINKPMNVAIKF